MVKRIDRILTTSGLENEFIARAAAALRSCVARDIHQLGHRAFSRLAADSDIVRKFMHLIDIDGTRTTISKSVSQRHATFVSTGALRRINDKLHAHFATAAAASPGLGGGGASGVIGSDWLRRKAFCLGEHTRPACWAGRPAAPSAVFDFLCSLARLAQAESAAQAAKKAA